MTGSTIALTVGLTIIGWSALVTIVWGVRRYLTRDERRRRRDVVRRLRVVFDDAFHEGKLSPEKRAEIESGLRRLHRG